MLEVGAQALYDESITSIEFHTHTPYGSTRYGHNDEIRIPINQQDAFTLPSASVLYIKGSVTGTATAANGDVTVTVPPLINNAVAYLFDEIRYELAGTTVCRNKNVGMTSTLKNIVSAREGEANRLLNACWCGPETTMNNGKDFVYCLPLRMLLGFAEDYPRIITTVKQELVLLRSSHDGNAVFAPDSDTVALVIHDISWKVPFVKVSPTYEKALLELIAADTPLQIPFRSWELHERPAMRLSEIDHWAIKTSSAAERPRYVIVGLQTARRNNHKVDNSKFDLCDIQSVKLTLNSQIYPYEWSKRERIMFYEMFTRFQQSYYNTSPLPALSPAEFTAHTPIIVLDCSKHVEAIKSAAVDISLDFECGTKFPADTTAYSLIIYDTLLEYLPLSGTVRVIT